MAPLPSPPTRAYARRARGTGLLAGAMDVGAAGFAAAAGAAMSPAVMATAAVVTVVAGTGRAGFGRLVGNCLGWVGLEEKHQV